MKKLFFLAGVIAAMTSCVKNEVSDVNAGNPDAIKFSTYVGQTTKGTVLDQAGVQASGFGVMGYYTEGNTWLSAGAAATPNFMYNQKVEHAGSAWSYSPIKYWPNTEGEMVSFFTYAPYGTDNNGVAMLSANTAKGLPQVEVTLADDAADMIDFVAGQNMDMKRQKEQVVFNMKHQMTRVTFSGAAAAVIVDNVANGANENGDGASYVVVKSMDVVGSSEFYSKGIYTHNSVTTNGDKADHTQDGSWAVSTPVEYSLSSLLNKTKNQDLVDAGYTVEGAVIPVANKASDIFATDKYLFLLPPSADAGLSDGGVKINIAYDIVTIHDALADGHIATPGEFEVSLPAGTLAQGKAYDYQLQFDVTEVLVDANIVDWDDSADSGNVGGGDQGQGDDDSYDVAVDTDKLGGLTTDNAGDKIEDVVSGADADKITRWESTNEAVATIDADGVVTLEGAAGTATINGYAEIITRIGALENEELVVTYDITVGEGTAAEELTTEVKNNDLGDLFVGDTADTKVTATPEAVITWTSSNSKIASVDENGIVTAVAGGAATITGTTEKGASIEFTVEVYSKLLSFNANPSELEIDVDQTATITFEAVYQPYVNAAYREGIKNTRADISSADITLSNGTPSIDGYTVTVTGDAACEDAPLQVKAQGKKSGNETVYEVCTITVVGDEAPKFDYDSGEYNTGLYVDKYGKPQFFKDNNSIGIIIRVADDHILVAGLQAFSSRSNLFSQVKSMDATNQDCGYENTNTIKFNSYIANQCWNKGEVAALLDPNDKTKGHWYMPAINELLEFKLPNGDTNSGILELIQNATTTVAFYSSTEVDASEVYGYYGDDGSGTTLPKAIPEWSGARGSIPVIRF